LALKDFRPQRDAFLTQRLRDAGAVILGKTNLSEWANIRSTRSTSGWSGAGGQTKNPYVLDRNPCGSSAGSGAAVAANLAVAAIGTETDGSVICPSSVNGLVGLKPTVGLVSRDGIVPISHSQDTAGPMTRSVADSAILLAAMAGRDAADPATGAAANATPDYPAHLRPDALKGARIGVLRDKFAMHPDAAAAMEGALRVLRDAGAAVVDAKIATDGQWDKDEGTLFRYELKADLQHYFDVHPNAPAKSLAQVIEFNKQHAAEEMPFFGQELFEQAEAKGDLNTPEYIAARDNARRLAGPEGIDAALKAQHLDALIAPATGPAWPTDQVLGDHDSGEGYGVAAVAGYPSLTVPMGDSNGLPLGIVFIGAAWSEARLIELGYAYEQLTHARKPPQYLPTLTGKPVTVALPPVAH
jgi:amidase